MRVAEEEIAPFEKVRFFSNSFMPQPVATEQSGISDAEALRDTFLEAPTSQDSKTDGRDAPSKEVPGEKDGTDDKAEKSETEKVETPEKPEEGDKAEAKEKPEKAETEDDAKKEGEKTDEEKDKKKAEGEGHTFTIGERTFEKIEDVVKEASRIIGRNGQLAGDLNVAKSDKEAAIKALEEAKQINETWVTWYKDKNGTAPPSADPVAVAKELHKLIKKENADHEAVATLKTRSESLRSLSNWSEVSSIVEKLTDKENPITGEKYTPEEAYDQACVHQGLENLRKAKKPAETTKAAEGKQEQNTEEKPKEKAKAPIKSAAARPSGGGSGPAPKPKSASSTGIDDLLAAKLMD